MNVLKVLSVRRFKVGYEVRCELRESPCKGGDPFEMKSAYNPDGDYIGESRTAKRLVCDRGIQPRRRAVQDCICTIGYSVKDGKWYGWSHRAIYGFQVGSTCKKGDSHYTPRRHKGRGAWTAKTTADARQMAIDFAESVS